MSTTAIWGSAEWLAEATGWLDDRLAEAGISRTGDVTQPHLQPWGTAVRASTTAGPVWLKAPAAGTVFEVALYPVLHRLVPDRVLAPIAADLERGWLLIPDGGPSLRAAADRHATGQADGHGGGQVHGQAEDHGGGPADSHSGGRVQGQTGGHGDRQADGHGGGKVQGQTDSHDGGSGADVGSGSSWDDAVAGDRPAAADRLVAGLVDVLPRYGRLQRELMPHVEELLAAGVVDMRAAMLPQRFDEAIEAAAIAGDPGIIGRIAGRRAWFVDLAASLAASPIPASLDHGDLHTDNIFAEGTRFYDWGDCVVGHPFGTMLVSLWRLDDDRPRDAYLEVFTDLAPREELLSQLRAACTAANVVRALTWHRALLAQGYDQAGEFATAPVEHLAMLLTEEPWRMPE